VLLEDEVRKLKHLLETMASPAGDATGG
jgi:hypothetical protein